MSYEIYTRKIKTITGNTSTKIKITPTPGKRLFGVQLNITDGSATVLATLLALIIEIRVKVGTRVRWRLTGKQLHDFCLLRGATFGFNITGTAAQVSIPLSPEWFAAEVQDRLAWNPAILGGDISIEIDGSAALTVTNAFERVNDNLSAASAGIITLEVLNPVAGGQAFYVEKEIDPTGRLIQATIYGDSTNNRQITPASLFVGRDDAYAHEALTYDENKEALERQSLTPEATGRVITGSIYPYDIVFVKDDGLARGLDLSAAGVAKIKVEAGAAMAGTCAIMLARIEPN